MTGLEKMKSQILEEAHTCAEKILEDTRKEADEILAQRQNRKLFQKCLKRLMKP